MTPIRQEDLEKAREILSTGNLWAYDIDRAKAHNLLDKDVNTIAQALADQREHIAKGCEGMYSEVKGSEIAKYLREKKG